MKKKKITLNPLQQRTLALFQVLAEDRTSAVPDAESGEVSVSYFPKPHGDHVHIGNFVVSAKDASGFSNEAVWRALERKGLLRASFPLEVVLTREGLAYETGFRDQFEHSNH